MANENGWTGRHYEQAIAERDKAIAELDTYRDAHNKLWTNYREVCVEADGLERKVDMCTATLYYLDDTCKNVNGRKELFNVGSAFMVARDKLALALDRQDVIDGKERSDEN